MTAPGRNFDPFGSGSAPHSADPEVHLAAPAPAGGMQPAHTSIFEIGGEPFSKSPAPSARLGRVAGLVSGGSLSSTTSPVGLRPLGSLMGSPHTLFNDPAYGSSAVASSAAPSPATQAAQSAPHGVAQTRFGGGAGRGGDNVADPAAAQPVLDMSNGLLDTMQSQQASPSAATQPGLSEFFVKSLPVSRRNSREFQNLWQELEGFTISDGAAHMSAFDGHSAGARAGSTSAFHGENGTGAGNLGASPKLPHGLLDDDVLSVMSRHASDAIGPPTAPATNGASRNPGAGRVRIGSVAGFAAPAAPSGSAQPGLSAGATPAPGFGGDFAHGQHCHPAYQRDASAGYGGHSGAQQTHRPSMTGVDGLPGDPARDPRLYDAGRNVGLIRNASTPSLSAKQYQALHTLEDHMHPSGMRHDAPPAAALADMPALMYAHQYHAYQAAGNMPAYDLAGARLPQNATNFAYGGSASAAIPGRSQSFVGSAQGPLGPGVPGLYAIGPRLSNSQTALQQHAHYPHSHIHMNPQLPPAQPLQQHGKPPAQRSAHLQQQQQQQAGLPAGSGAHHHQKHQHGKPYRKGDPEANRFANTQLEELKGSIFDVCKDQHGCRYLQKKLEDGQESHVHMIFTEVLPHFSLLMTDPFGNYLCQKLLEHCSEAQRTQIVTVAAPDLVSVSLNMHGTRAVQKMIDLLSNQEQIDAIIEALRGYVVMLIRDLNGNHVIQKCLGRLSGANNQFIYDAVAASCADVATHRHGCCVFQRCIDYATLAQKAQLVNVVISQALSLVQDPFGNYVVQYVLDLNVPEYVEPLVSTFVGHICALSVQKFSSNVMEKCIRQASPGTRRQLVAPLMQRDKLDMLMRDSYGNYVVQTALDFADPQQRIEIIEAILPLLPLIRNTPYGKRIYNKLQRDGFISAVPSAAGSRHASPTLGPSLGAHPPPAMSSMALYPQMAHPAAMPPGAGPMGMAAPAPGLSRGTSPSVNGAGANPPISHPRTYVAGGAFQQSLPPLPQQQQPGSTGAPYYFMTAMDAAATVSMVHPGAPMMVPVHPGSMLPVSSGIYDHAAGGFAGVAPVATSSAPSSARTRMSPPAHYGTR
ncbi:hypothetical protein LPJ61_001315 [Coemansia biformis]|uniref:PUM-HD domain-containing protein n=1 Tax=Coemansia biformis TaxID=1286918 RepID=A0A9W7YGP0_9FUNG|nr:hypothetical protein LPJ61_001315 [Coemansia biformis]